ncbi:MAG TPA: FAD:protein FMN transferase, partial [Candidatus Polarisedimenticolaceae bacterium]|nr:FAD:protein FMN transferase [Candidatus Polarisedimenticolaceae bacterium]
MLAARSVSIAVVLAALVAPACGPPASRSDEWEALDSSASAVVVMRRAADAAELLGEIRRRTETATVTLDPFADDGELGRMNRVAPDRFYEIEQVDLFACLRLALDYAEESDGAYDPTIGALDSLYASRLETAEPPRPAEIDVVLTQVGWEKVTVEPEVRAVRYRAPRLVVDLGPVAVGCAVDWAARAFARPGSIGGLIRVGGAHRAWGRPPDRPSWAVGLDDPRSPGRTLVELDVTNRGVAVCGQPATSESSGQARLREIDVLDPRTGRPAATDLLAVVTTADSAADAAALCHVIHVAGSLAGTDIFREMRRAETVMLVRADDGPPYLVASASLRGRLRLSEALSAEV